MKLLILGSQGFVGSYLVEYFLNKGDDVFGCDLREGMSSKHTFKKVSILSSDFETLFLNDKFDVCINASGSGHVEFSIANPISDFEANTYSVAKVLDTIRKYQSTCKYIHISSAAVYGNPRKLPVVETDVSAPVSPYGYNKLMSELLCKEYHYLYNLPIAIVRPFSIYGIGLRKQLLWDICEKINAADTVTLYGTGAESRDFLHISDFCQIVDKIIARSEFKVDIFNAAAGIETTIRQIADIFESNFLGQKKIIFSGEFKVGNPINWKADMSKMARFDFKPVVFLDEGIDKYINWYFSEK